MKKLIFILLLSFSAFAQEIVPESQRDVVWVYAEDESPYNSKCKILLVSSYIHRHKYKDTDAQDRYSNASNSYYNNILNAFNKKLDDIKMNERITSASGSNDLVWRSYEVTSSHDGFNASGYCPTTVDNDPVDGNSTFTFAHQCRENFIDQKRSEGYHVFQLQFDEYYETRGQYNDLFGESEFAAAKDQVDKLSPLYVDVYRKGDIKGLSDFGSPSRSGSSSSASSSSSSSLTASSPTPAIDAYYQMRISQCSTTAGVVERSYQEALQSNSMQAWNEVVERCDEFFDMGCPVYGDRVAEIKRDAISKQQAFVDAIAALAYFNWEFCGTSTTMVQPRETSTDKPTKFNMDEVRMIFTLGKKHLRLNISPVGFSWVDIPDFKKYNAAGEEIGESSLTMTRFYSPSIGLSYVLYPPLEFEDGYRIFEFPISVSFGSFFAAKTDTYEPLVVETDTPFKDYYADFNYFVHGSIGASIYFGPGFGLTAKAGVVYMGVDTTTKMITDTNRDGVAEEFTIKMDEEQSRFLPSVSLSINIRF